MGLSRRNFLAGLAAGAGLLVTPEPVRRFWQVPGNAPVGALAEPLPLTLAGRAEYLDMCMELGLIGTADDLAELMTGVVIIS